MTRWVLFILLALLPLLAHEKPTTITATSSPNIMSTSFLPDVSIRVDSTISNFLNTSGNQQSLQFGESVRKALLIGETKFVAARSLVTDVLVYTVIEALEFVESGISDFGNFMVVEGEVCIPVSAEAP